jgi:hypothetical protein
MAGEGVIDPPDFQEELLEMVEVHWPAYKNAAGGPEAREKLRVCLEAFTRLAVTLEKVRALACRPCAAGCQRVGRSGASGNPTPVGMFCLWRDRRCDPQLINTDH